MILDRVRNTIQQYSLLEKGDKVIVACSGGLDSTALLLLLLELKQEFALELCVGHFNHRLRLNAEEDEAFVSRLAKERSLPAFVGAGDVRSYAREKSLNLEEAGRVLRYEFLKKTASNLGAKIATGHTLDDQAETFLMRLMRGSGLSGLTGIHPCVGGLLIRPLLQVERKDIEAYLKQKGVGFRLDESNLDRRFLRNKIRLDLIPYLQKNFDPQIISRIGKTVAILEQEEALLEKISSEAERQAVIGDNSQAVLDLEALSSLPPGLARRVVRGYLLKIRGSLRALSFEDVEAVRSLREGRECQLKKDLILRREKNQIFLKKVSVKKISHEYIWDGGNPLEIKELSLRFEAEKIRFSGLSSLDFDDTRRAFLDAAKLKFPLFIRSRREGDRYRPVGAPGRKKVKELLRSRAIPLSERWSRPVFCSGEEIAWIPGLPVSEKFKVSQATEEVFVIKKVVAS